MNFGDGLRVSKGVNWEDEKVAIGRRLLVEWNLSIEYYCFVSWWWVGGACPLFFFIFLLWKWDLNNFEEIRP